MQLVDQVVLPPSLQMEMEKRPKLALTRLMAVPSSHSISRVDPSHPYLVLRSEPATIGILNIKNISQIYYSKLVPSLSRQKGNGKRRLDISALIIDIIRFFALEISLSELFKKNSNAEIVKESAV